MQKKISSPPFGHPRRSPRSRHFCRFYRDRERLNRPNKPNKPNKPN